MKKMIEIKGLCKSFGQSKILSGLDLCVNEGEIVTLIGSSGCGKSVLLRCIEMLEKPDTGQIFINGQEITAKDADIRKIRQSMGMVYQDFGLFSNMNVMENLCIAPVKLLKMPKADAKKKALELLSAVGLENHGNRPVRVLSGGQKQRVAICRAMMMNPQIMLFDEPTSALDPSMIGEVLATIRMLSRRGLTMLIVTHEMDFARQISDRVMFLNDGVIYEQGTSTEIFDHPQRNKTIAFIRKLKRISYNIDRRNFNLIEMHGVIENFAIKYGLSKAVCYRLRLCSEEMVHELLNNSLNDDTGIQVNLEFSEADKTCVLSFLVKGEYFNPFTKFDSSDSTTLYDHLGLLIIKQKATHVSHTYENSVNIISIKM